jgi:hypothetical protein
MFDHGSEDPTPNLPVVQRRWRGLKAVTVSNWLSPDPTSRFISHVPHEASELAALLDVGNYFAERFTTLELSSTVSDNVARFFNVAKGTVTYAVFFYPLLEIGLERAYSAAEVAVRECAEQHAIPRRYRQANNKSRISWLCRYGWISPELCTRLQLTRMTRNLAKHQSQSILMPIDVVKTLGRIANDLESLATIRDCTYPWWTSDVEHDHTAGFPENR